MSASDAAPLPRLGEVFFDVRGNSRSMRLSWYADTGVAVFSIWQGGVCTGTFRLPMGELARMIEILQRGPQRRPQSEAEGYSAAAGHESDDYEYTEYGVAEPGAADYEPGARHRPSRAARHRGTDYLAADNAARDYVGGTYGPDDGGYQADFTGQERLAEADVSAYGQDRFVPPYVRPRRESYSNDNLAGGQRRSRRLDRPAYPADRPSGSSHSAGYPEPPPTVAGYFDSADYQLDADPGPATRHSAGKHSSKRTGRSGG